MTRRARWLGYGGAAALVVIGIACAVLISGGTGQVLAMALIGVGLVAAVSLVFLEIGLSEDRDRARSQEAVKRHAATADPDEKGRRPLRPRRPDRLVPLRR